LVCTKEKNKKLKTLLFILVSFAGLTATVSGLIIIGNPANGGAFNLPGHLLKDTPFKTFLVPGIALTIVGGINLLAVFYNIQRHPNRYQWAMAGGIVITGWIIAQLVLIQTISWLQFIYLGVGLLTILTAWQLKGKWVV
jgi:hypothetical protein